MEVLVSILSGKCICNKVSYSCNAEPIAIFNCHCKDCRKTTESVFGKNLFFSENNVEINVNTVDLVIIESKSRSFWSIYC